MYQLVKNTTDNKLIDASNIDESKEYKNEISIKEIFFSIIINLAMLFNMKGFVIGFIMWILLKHKSRFVYKTGRNIINYSIAYFMIMLFIGFIVWILFGNTFVKGTILLFKFFIIIGTYKCVRGKIYVYPLNIKVFD